MVDPIRTRTLRGLMSETAPNSSSRVICTVGISGEGRTVLSAVEDGIWLAVYTEVTSH